MTASQFIRSYPSPTLEPIKQCDPSHKCIIFYEDTPLLLRSGAQLCLPNGELAQATQSATEPIHLGGSPENEYFAWTIRAEDDIPANLERVGLRDIFGLINDVDYSLIGYAHQILHHLRTSLYCSACATRTQTHYGDWGRICPKCGLTQYPRISPAVLVLIHDGHRILMASKPGWGQRYSVVAGFVEPGETLEECAIREALEETGVTIGNIVYKGSQPWPFPHQLMVGFFAEYLGGEIVVDTTELADARWFDATNMPELPGPLSLSRQIIELWLERNKG